MTTTKSAVSDTWEGTVWKRYDSDGWFRYVMQESPNGFSLTVVCVVNGGSYTEQTSKRAISAWGEKITEEDAVAEIPDFKQLVEKHRKTLTKAIGSLQQWSMLIAGLVRNRMEDFHVEHLTDEQMQELNQLIRQAIFDALVAVWQIKSGNLTDFARGLATIDHAFMNCGSSWELPTVSAEQTEQTVELVKCLGLDPTIEFVQQHVSVI